MSIKIGVSPIAWSNDDFPELGGDTTLEQCLKETNEIGFSGIEAGGKFPKKSNELMAHTYSHLYGLPTTGLRFFTVYGPWGRPDMAYFSFTKAILEGKTIDVYNHGKMQRDFTYIDDIVEGVTRIANKIPTGVEGWSPESGDTSRSSAPYKIYNIGNHNTVELGTFIETIEKVLGKTADKRYLDMQPGDVLATYANVDDLIADVDFAPNTSLEVGLEKFVRWYHEFYKV